MVFLQKTNFLGFQNFFSSFLFSKCSGTQAIQGFQVQALLFFFAKKTTRCSKTLHVLEHQVYVSFFCFEIFVGERRGSNPRVMESQSIALPLGYDRHVNHFTIFYSKNVAKKKKNLLKD